MPIKTTTILAATISIATSFGSIAAHAQTTVMTCTTDTGETVTCPGVEAAHMTRAKIILGGGDPNDLPSVNANGGPHNMAQNGPNNPQPTPTLGQVDYGISPTQ